MYQNKQDMYIVKVKMKVSLVMSECMNGKVMINNKLMHNYIPMTMLCLMILNYIKFMLKVLKTDGVHS